MNAKAQRRLWIAVVFAVLAAAAAVALRGAYDATLLLGDLARIDLPLPDTRPAVLRGQLGYGSPSGEMAGDLYRPDDGSRAGVVLVPGAAEGGHEDPRLVEFAEALARSGFAVLVPDIRSLRELRLVPSSANEIAAAAGFLRRSGYLPQGSRLGIGAFSVASGPAALAALEPGGEGPVDFLLLVGGYYDLERTLAYLTTGWFEADHRRQHREPNAYGKWVYLLSNAGLLSDASERRALTGLARIKLDNPDADVTPWTEGLGVEGRAIYEFVVNTDPDRVPGLIRALPHEVRADIEALDLSRRDLSGLRARFILVHGLDDDIIPYSESVALAAALPPGQVGLYLLGGLHHVDRDFSSLDAWRMWRALKDLLAQRK